MTILSLIRTYALGDPKAPGAQTVPLYHGGPHLKHYPCNNAHEQRNFAVYYITIQRSHANIITYKQICDCLAVYRVLEVIMCRPAGASCPVVVKMRCLSH